MFEVHIACSDCPEELEVLVEDLDELEGLGCECGYGMVAIAVWEAEFEPRIGRVISLSRGEHLPLAA